MGVIPWATQFQNGDVAAKALMLDLDGGGNFLQPSAAVSFRQFAAAFRAEFGVDLTISEAFRDLPTQERYYDLYRRGIGNPAAIPGTSSHGQGLAVDINSWVYGNGSNTTRHQWLVNNAPRFGWSWELVGKPSGEPWHFNYVGGWADWASDNITPLETEEQREERELMAAIEEIRALFTDLKKTVEAGRGIKLVAVIIPERKLNGWLWVDEEGGDWVLCPGDPYAKLAAAWGLSQPSPIREVRSASEWDFITDAVLDALEPDNPVNSSAQVKNLALQQAVAVAALPDTKVRELLANQPA